MSDSDLEKSPISVKRAREESFGSVEPEEEQVTLPPPSTTTTIDTIEEQEQQQTTTTIATTIATKELVDPKDQPQVITHLKEQHFKQGNSVSLISSRWYKRWEQYCTRMSSSQEDARNIGQHTNPGPINNQSILSNGGSLMENLKYNENVIGVPGEAWKKFVEWYGVTEDSEWAIERQVIEDSQGKLIVELYPPTFRLYAITTESSKNSNHMTRCPVFTLSETNFVHDFIQSVKDAFDLTPDTEIQIWILVNTPSEQPFVSVDIVNNSTLFESNESDNLSDYSGYWNIAVEVKDKIDNKFPSDNISTTTTTTTTKSSSSSVSSASSLMFANGFNNLTTSSTPPTTSSFISSVVAPTRMFSRGVCGLNNLGNTCFMNSALQCLSNTPQLTKYFLADLFKRDLNPDNPLGMKGKVAEAYGELIAELWSGSSSNIAPREFKYTIGRFNSSFSGYQQHDTQELLAFLLDGLHEDLNRIIKKPYIELPDFDGMKDQEIATKSWDYHKARNDSVIVDLFQGQFKSRLICEECKNVSVTFDPFMYLSLPLPIKKKSKTTIIYVPYDPSQRLQRMVVTTSKEASIAHLQKEIAKMMHVQDPNCLLVLEIFSHKIYKVFAQYEPVATIGQADVIYVYELPGPVPPLPSVTTATAAIKKKKPSYKYRYNQLSQDEEEDDEDLLQEKQEPVDPEQLIVFPVYCATVEKSSSAYVSERVEHFGEPIILAVPHKDASQPELLYSLVLQHVERYTQFKLFEEVNEGGQRQDPLVLSTTEETVQEEENVLEKYMVNGNTNPFLQDNEEDDDEYKRIDSNAEEEDEQEGKLPAYLEPSSPATTTTSEEPFTIINKITNEEEMEIDQIPPQVVHTAAAVTAAGGKKTEPMINLFAMKVFSGHQGRNSYHRSTSEELLPTTVPSWSGLTDLYERAQSEQKQLQAYLAQLQDSESCTTCSNESEFDQQQQTKQQEQEDTEMEDSIVLPSKMESDDDEVVQDAATMYGAGNDDAFDLELERELLQKKNEETDDDNTEADSNANASIHSEETDSDRGFLTNSSIIQPATEPILAPKVSTAPVLPKRKITHRPPPATIIRQGEGILLAWTPKKAQQLFGTARGGGVSTDAWEEIQELGDPAAQTDGDLVNAQKTKQVTLSDCLDEFTKEEVLSEEDLWYCPKCKKHQRATKKFDLWRMPEIMVVHLKRFSHSRAFRDKIDALIDFPTTEPLDLTDRVLSLQDQEHVSDQDRLIYDLYGVDNHYGGLGGGHYTSFAQNFEDEQWYNFDDSHVTRVDVADIKTSAAYLLFYKRRRPINNETTQSVEEIIQEAHEKQQAALKERRQQQQQQQDQEMSIVLPPQVPIVSSTRSSMMSSSDIEDNDDEVGPPAYDTVAQDQLEPVHWAVEQHDEPICEWPPSTNKNDTEDEEEKEEPL